jgi:DNA-directed RNA polymerase alpha subunit
MTQAVGDRSCRLPDSMYIVDTQLPTIVKNALQAAGLETVGQARNTDDALILRIRNIAKDRLELIREALG